MPLNAVIHLSPRFSSTFCCCFLHFIISSKYNFHIDAERMIVKTREISASMVEKNVWHDTSSVGKICRYF